jgi:hypothetical protein
MLQSLGEAARQEEGLGGGRPQDARGHLAPPEEQGRVQGAMPSRPACVSLSLWRVIFRVTWGRTPKFEEQEGTAGFENELLGGGRAEGGKVGVLGKDEYEIFLRNGIAVLADRVG